jgi:hypothetical protein
MPPLDIKREVDEVWLALEQTDGALRRDGHKPGYDMVSCELCYCLSLISRAKQLYLANRRVNGEATATAEAQG